MTPIKTVALWSGLVQTGLDVSAVITDRFPANRWEEAFAAARRGNGGKVVIDWL